ncbi:hypothetical protein CRG98_050261 [Punica granatum]|uniref:Uncharacterized protein n=1 Tax=Punica granatum TaxID=22663 RepID=A0A2I0GK12_PUNGR|nr:hypothetical protein CRG98_050261 [Punica granatum]
MCSGALPRLTNDDSHPVPPSSKIFKISLLSALYALSLPLSLSLPDLRFSGESRSETRPMALRIVYGLVFLSFSCACFKILHLFLRPVFYLTS